MTYVNTEIADKYQEFFNFMVQEHDLILTIEEIDEMVFEAQKLVKNFTKPIVERSEHLKCEHQPKRFDKKYTICEKCGKILQMKP